MFKKQFLVAITIVTCMQMYAQKSTIYTNDFAEFQNALELYNNKQYLAAQSLFESVAKTTKLDKVKADCDYYIAHSAIRLSQINAGELVEEFVKNHPTSTKRNSAYIDVADYYFNKRKYSRAIKWYKKVDENAMSIAEKEKYNFNYGYAAFSTKKKKEAKKYLSRVETSSKYGSQAKYYIGYLAYQGDDYNRANVYFDQVKEDDEYKEKLTYYQADLNFKSGKFEEAIQLAKAQLDKSNRKELSELNKIIGESYFNLKKYKEAIPYLSKYKGRRGKWSNTDYYQLGYAYYKQNDYEKAISEFNKIIGGKNSVAQNAYYHLGESYIKLNKKQEALNAFKNASEMEYDENIQADAFLNYAKISYDIGNPYQSVPEVLTNYVKKYPDSEHKEAIELLVIDSYITSKNYAEAMELLRGKNSPEGKLAYQKVGFYRGLELLTDAKYKQAKKLFELSLKERQDSKITALTLFWKAETDYNLGDYNEALLGFKAFKQQKIASKLSVYKTLNYNLAYTYFKQKNYVKAIEYFKKYVTHKGDKIRLNDAYLRLADAYFVKSKYNEAISAYNKAISIGDLEKDYAYFQRAMCYGYVGKVSKKNSNLENFLQEYSKSKLRDDALYALGNSYVTSNKVSKAMAKYDELVGLSWSPFVPKTLLRQGLVYYNKGDNTNALTKFKHLAAKYPGTPEAKQAVGTIRLIHVDKGTVDEYANWVKDLDYVEVTDADLDNATYEAAEKQFLANKTDVAIKQFNKYIAQFPRGLHATQAHFYLAQCYFKTDLKNNAVTHYKYVVDKPQNEFSEEALLRYSQITLENKKWEAALPALKRLEAEANFSQNAIFAQSNLMQAYYQLKNYAKAVSYAESVLAQPNVDNKVKSDAQIIIARSALKNNNEAVARQAYKKLLKTAKGEVAAEALYYNALYAYKDKKYESSNTMVQRLVKEYSSYKYYGAKGLIVMAKNFYALKDAYQATYILESVISNFTQFNTVVTEAKAQLKLIKAKESKTNSSVKTD